METNPLDRKQNRGISFRTYTPGYSGVPEELTHIGPYYSVFGAPRT